MFFTWKCIKIIFFFYFKKIIFDISASKWFENTKNISIWSKEIFFLKKIIFDTSVSKWFEKTQKIYQFEAKKKNTKFLNFFKSTFETLKQTEFYETQLKKHVKTVL